MATTNGMGDPITNPEKEETISPDVKVRLAVLETRYEHTATKADLEKAIGDMGISITEAVGDMRNEVARAIGQMEKSVVGVKVWVLSGILIGSLTIVGIGLTAYKLFFSSSLTPSPLQTPQVPIDTYCWQDAAALVLPYFFNL